MKEIKNFPFNEGKKIKLESSFFSEEYTSREEVINIGVPSFIEKGLQYYMTSFQIMNEVTYSWFDEYVGEYETSTYSSNQIRVEVTPLCKIPDLIPGYLGKNPKKVPWGGKELEDFFHEILSSGKKIRFRDLLGRSIPVYQEQSSLLDWEGNIQFGYWSETDDYIDIYVKSVKTKPNQNRVFRHSIGFLSDETRSDVEMLDRLLHISKEKEICCCSHDQWTYSRNHVWVEVSGIPTRSFDRNVYSKIGRDGKRHVRKNKTWVRNSEEFYTYRERKEGKSNYLFDEIFVKEVVINKVIVLDKNKEITKWCKTNKIKLVKAPIDCLNIGDL